MNDNELREGLTRRAANSLTPDERNDLLRAARLAAVEPRRRSFVPRIAGWVAGAAAVLVLVILVAPVLLSPPLARPSPAKAAPAPTAGIKIYTSQELANMVGDPAWLGKTVLAEATFGTISMYGYVCPPPDEPCLLAALEGVDRNGIVLFGWRDATADDGVKYDDGNGYRWIRQLEVPTGAGTYAFTIRNKNAEYLGPSYVTDAREPVNVSDIHGISSTLPSDGVIAVRGWLTKNWPPPPCPEPQLATPKPATDYYCYGTWLTPAADSSLDQGVHVQNDAYEFFTANPSEDANGVSPQQGTYLVRNAGCPEQAPCPAFRVVGRLDDSSTTPIATTKPPSAPPDTPSPTSPANGLTVYTASELANMVGDAHWVGNTVLADIRVGDIENVPCATATTCDFVNLKVGQRAYMINIGTRDATAEDGVQLDDGNGYRWVKRLEVPSSGLLAFAVGQDGLDYLGPAHLSPESDPVAVADVKGISTTLPSDGVIAVRGWLTHTMEAPCAFPQEGLQSPMPDVSSYYCGGSWLTEEATAQPVSGLTIDGGLHVQNDAYSSFAIDPQSADGGGYQPRQGVYLVRNAGCPEVVTGDCPVWRMVGRLDGAVTVAPPRASPAPESVPIQTSAPASGCDQALLSGELVADATWGLAVKPTDGDVVGVIWPNGFTAQGQGDQIALIDDQGASRAITGETVLVGGGLTTDNVWGACGQIEVTPTNPTSTAEPPTSPLPPATPTDPAAFSFVHLDDALAIARAQIGDANAGVYSYAAERYESAVQFLFGPGTPDTAPPGLDWQSMVWGVVFKSGDAIETVYIDVFDGEVLHSETSPWPANPPPQHKSDIVFDPPIVHVQNGTSLPVTVNVNGLSSGVFEVGSTASFDAGSLTPSPWLVIATTPTGRELMKFTFKMGDVYGTTGDYPQSQSSAGGRTDLSCGRLDIWIGAQPLGPAPYGSYPPGDCDP